MDAQEVIAGELGNWPPLSDAGVDTECGAEYILDALTAAGYAVVKLPEPSREEPYSESEGYGTVSFDWGKASTVMATFPNGRVWDEDADLSIKDARDLAAALLAAAQAAEKAGQE